MTKRNTLAHRIEQGSDDVPLPSSMRSGRKLAKDERKSASLTGRNAPPRKRDPEKRFGWVDSYTEDEVRDALESAGGVVSWAAAKLQCQPTTVYRYLNKYPKLGELHRQLTSGFASVAHGVVSDSILDGDVDSAKWYLNRRDREFKQDDTRAAGEVVIRVVYEDAPPALPPAIDAQFVVMEDLPDANRNGTTPPDD